MWTLVVLMIPTVASPLARTSVSAIVVRGGTTVISNSDAGRILDAYIASILKGIMRTGFMPCNVRRAPDEAMHCQAHSLDADQLDKSPGASPAQLQERCEACEGPLEDETPAASTSLVARRRQNYGELRKPVDKSPPSVGGRHLRGFSEPFAISSRDRNLRAHSSSN